MSLLRTQWRICEIAISQNMGMTSTPYMLRKAVVKYVQNKGGGYSGGSVIKYLSVKQRWTWGMLEYVGGRIAKMSKRHNLGNKENEEIDVVVGNALISLSRSCRDKESKDRERYRRKLKWYNSMWDHCELCWRFVPNHKTFGGPERFCTKHQAPSKGYQKHRRKQAHAKANYLQLFHLPVDDPTQNPPQYPGGWLKIYYPHTHDYILKNTSIDVVNMTWMALLALLDDQVDPRGTRLELHQELANDPEQILSFIGWAESWLSAIKVDGRGGKRNGAGRKTKCK